jgi:hypothetical protein
MAVITPSKSQGQVLLAHTQQATATVTRGSAIDVSAKHAIRYFVSLGRSVATALTNEVLFRLEASAKSSANDEWFPLYQWTSLKGKTAATSTTINDGAVSASDTTFVLTSGTGIVSGDFIYLRETGTPANSEWVRVDSISTNTVTCEALTRSHTNGIAVTDLAERFTGEVDCSGIGRLRLVVDTAENASGQTVDVIAWYNVLDNVTVT